MVNKKISSFFAILTIALFAVVTGTFLYVQAEKVDNNVTFSSSPETYKTSNLLKKEKNRQNVFLCQSQIFQGVSKIKVWQDQNKKENNNKNFPIKVKIKKEDISKLPMENVDEIVLVDADIHLKKSLMVSSEKKPIEITITGFARKCDGINLASIKYKEGIFGIE
ncbi:MAG: hypothetical protein COZ85_01045 [Candidatus Moranbacteria bacterium CG_4_8_14_3_um_filter_34_16]|nr:MAG: hypothetical protein COT31_00080 [Candidatus Moranbacteria bacterium CG08_land_8_20_14_0_20_34_16]PIW95219.1 MAG: hypothetical protein COZ85_01045 [Candidatus Moranbacteria bacterium CG_4_8_14_3_um_filter_34_16]PJA89374.1 MAG: hypothetical protein CO138_00830 [Candidatus Moranbacteria bacterium CG_4_9_14_3_um_filter_33_15]